VDEADVGDAGADIAQDGDRRHVVASAEAAVLRSHAVDELGSRRQKGRGGGENRKFSAG
jgi:hypothetical protein